MAELGFSTTDKRGRDLMHYDNITIKLRYKISKEGFKTSILMDVIDVIYINEKSTRYKHRFGINPACVNHLRILGEYGTIKINPDRTPKAEYQGVHCIMIGYALNHNGYC